MPFLTSTRFDDPRPELKKLRRGTLKKICNEAGLAFEQTTSTADDLRTMVTSNNLDVSKYINESHKLGKNQAASQTISRLTEENKNLSEQVTAMEEKFSAKFAALEGLLAKSTEKTVEKDEIPEDFVGLPIWRLRQLAKTLDIPCERTDKAETIIGKLNDHVANRRQ